MYFFRAFDMPYKTDIFFNWRKWTEKSHDLFVNTPNCFMCAQLLSNFNNNHNCSVNINYWIHKQNVKHRNKKTVHLIPTDRKFPCPEDVGFLDRRCARDFRKSVSAEADKLVAAMLKLHKRQNINQSKLHACFFILGHECCHQFWLHMW